MLAKAPEVTLVKTEKNYNEVGGALTQRWGTGDTSNGRSVENLYGTVAIPEVGARPAGGELNKALSPEEIKARGWGATKAGAMFGNEKYELLTNGLKAELTKSEDIKPKAAGKATGSFTN